MARALDFYQHVIGLRVLQQDEAGAWLGASVNVPLLRLDAFPDAVLRPPRTTGLYHFAILLPAGAPIWLSPCVTLPRRAIRYRARQITW